MIFGEAGEMMMRCCYSVHIFPSFHSSSFSSSFKCRPNPLRWSVTPKCKETMSDKNDEEEFMNMSSSSSSSAYQVLGIDPNNCSPSHLKAAFRAKVKEFHPDVRRDDQTSDAMIRRVIWAYQTLSNFTKTEIIERECLDPFDEPECEAFDIFVNEALCAGKGTQEEAAEAYDMAAIEYRGPNAVTNFDVSVYASRLKEKNIELRTTSQQQPQQQQPQQQQQQQQQQKWDEQSQEQQEEKYQPQDLNSEIPSSMVEMHDEHASWSLCMGLDEFHPLPIPDVTYGRGGGELPYLFGESGFHDDIDFIFDGPTDETLSFDTDSFFVSSAAIKEEETQEEEEKSPSSSTTTLVCCN